MYDSTTIRRHELLGSRLSLVGLRLVPVWHLVRRRPLLLCLR